MLNPLKTAILQSGIQLYFELRLPIELEGEIFVTINNLGGRFVPHVVRMEQQVQGHWTGCLSLKVSHPQTIGYHYFARRVDGLSVFEEGERKLNLSFASGGVIRCIDTWRDSGLTENTFLKAPFQTVFFRQKEERSFLLPPGATHLFRVRTLPLAPDEVLCLVGDFSPDQPWDIRNPVPMHLVKGQWMAGLALTAGRKYEYKYGVCEERGKTFRYYEQGSNRQLVVGATEAGPVVVTDNFFHHASWQWKGAGVSVPVFSLRSENSAGIGEFDDLKKLIDWAQRAELKLIQLLPVNDTTATGSWHDSYPYAAISAFALNPVYINLEKAGKLPENSAVYEEYIKTKGDLARMSEVAYEKVLYLKWQYLRTLFALTKADFLRDKHFKAFFRQHRHWLMPYAVFCFLRDRYGTADHIRFGPWSVYDHHAIVRLAAPSQPDYEQVAIHYFVQFHLHKQLEEVKNYAHRKGVILKGDIPIGISRHSVEAWMYPDKFNLDSNAGAPPDGFAAKGQNWGFPTYRWQEMERDQFRWWLNRLRHLAIYFDAIRFDHILGFFRIWQIPENQVEAVMGYFQPDLPLSAGELEASGICFDQARFCDPFINEQILQDLFGKDTPMIEAHFLESKPGGRYRFKPSFSTQTAIDRYFRDMEYAGKSLAGHLCLGLFELISNVLFLRAGQPGYFRPRIDMMSTTSFQELPADVQQKLSQVHDTYFYQRHDAFWRKEALRKLPALKKATSMLVCGEDLGMIPESVPQLMNDLGLLSLEVQRMPKQAGQEFTVLGGVPYLSVVTPGTHDMSTIRGWWEEDPGKVQRFFNEVLGHPGAAPHLCEPWLVRQIIEQHLQSPAMWAVISLQDLLGMSAALRLDNPHDERINIPANAHHYWRYRMHLTLEQLLDADEFTAMIGNMIRRSKRSL